MILSGDANYGTNYTMNMMKNSSFEIACTSNIKNNDIENFRWLI